MDTGESQIFEVAFCDLKTRTRWEIRLFPYFIFELIREEYESLRSQFGTLKRGEHSKYPTMEA
jgi:hypothetical protein